MPEPDTLNRSQLLLQQHVSLTPYFPKKVFASLCIGPVWDSHDADVDDTLGHQKRTAHYAKRIAERLGLPEHECELIFISALLHDFGKFGDDDPDTLFKNDRLTKSEYEKVMTHSENGGLFVRDHLSREDAERIALYVEQHHERLDGSGYPFGLKGEAITLGGRILALADTYDALVSKRTYKDAISPHEALAIIEQDSITLFDRACMEALVHIVFEDGPTAPQAKHSSVRAKPKGCNLQ